MSSRHHIDDFMRGRIIGKIEEGRKITDVAREFDIAHSVVSRLWKSFKTTGMCSRRHGGGRVRSTTPAEDRYIVLSAKRNRRTTAQQGANQFLAASGKQISQKTVARRLRGGGLYARRPVVCVPLTIHHLRSTKLHIKPSKCQIAQAYVKYFEHLVGQSLRTPGELKVQVINDFPIPTNKTQDRNLKSTVDWNSSCQNAFEEVKTRLSKNPVLYSSDFTKPFIIQCEASNLGIGVVLSQVCENEEHAIMFLSKKLSLAEQKYSTIEKECAAIIFTMQKLKCYVDGHQKFVIQTDHNPLVWLEKNTGTNPRLLRWALILQ
ncbi:retrovirus-related Pol polyprotein from transposon 297 [Trichonephila clavipes]|nr:retrovirus-related Pol polyprotein from transposon 297 [Trichonephila clavipes]